MNLQLKPLTELYEEKRSCRKTKEKACGTPIHRILHFVRHDNRVMNWEGAPFPAFFLDGIIDPCYGIHRTNRLQSGSTWRTATATQTHILAGEHDARKSIIRSRETNSIGTSGGRLRIGDWGVCSRRGVGCQTKPICGHAGREARTRRAKRTQFPALVASKRSPRAKRSQLERAGGPRLGIRGARDAGCETNPIGPVPPASSLRGPAGDAQNEANRGRRVWYNGIILLF